MADAPILYKKLPGTGSSALARIRLWEGPDHLLVVTSWPSGEGYRRFFYRDIQAIIVRQTARRLWINILLLVFALITVGPILTLDIGSIGERILAAIVAGIWLVFILINSLMGGGCETLIQTAIQTERIASLGRQTTVQKVLARIQPRILEAQAEPAPAPAAF